MKFTGEKGAIKIKPSSGTAVAIGKMRNWKLSVSADTVDVSSFDSNGWAENETSLKSWSGSSEGIFKKDDTNGQKAVLKALADREDVELEFYTNKEDAEADFKGKAKVTSFEIETSLKDELKISFNFEGNGALTGSAMPTETSSTQV